jgi:signal transduction histidine kinase
MRERQQQQGIAHGLDGALRAKGSSGRALAHALTFRQLLDLVLTSTDYESALAAVAHLTLPTFGEWSIIDVIDRPDTMRRVAIIHPDPEKQELARTLPAGWPPETEDPIGAPVVMRTRELHVVHEVTDEMLVKFARNEEILRALRQLGMGSFVVVPLVVGNDVLGAVTFVSSGAGNRYTEADLAEAQELAALIALVVHNARLHRDAQRARDRALRTAEEATRQQRDLERVMDVQSRLVRGFSHDLKNPLGAALGYAQLLASGIKGDLPPEQQASVARICASIQSSLDLIEDLVAYASRGMQKLDIQPGPTDVLQIAHQIAEEYQGQIEAAGLELRIDVAEDIPLIRSDRIRIRQILGNLLSNAIKFTEEGHVTVRAEVRQNGALPDGLKTVALSVSDTGHGIPAEKQGLLFQEFARLEPSATAGVGLGLAISRSIARALGGEISVASVEGEGSTFTLSLPLIPVREADGAQPKR